MTALSPELLERAERHGLVRIDGRWRTASRDVVWGSDVARQWVWCPPEERISSISVDYPTEADALTIALHWLDLQDPKRAWKPAPWAPVVEVLRMLRGSCETLAEAPSIAAHAEAESLQEAIALLEQTTLGPNMASTPEQALSLLLDMAGDRGGELGEGLREQLRRVLQARPDEAVQLVASLQIAGPWKDGQRVSVGHASEIDQLLIAGQVLRDGGLYEAEVEGEQVRSASGAGLWSDEQIARAHVDAELIRRGYSLAGGPVQAPEPVSGVQSGSRPKTPRQAVR